MVLLLESGAACTVRGSSWARFVGQFVAHADDGRHGESNVAYYLRLRSAQYVQLIRSIVR